jgi:hypothetical protein
MSTGYGDSAQSGLDTARGRDWPSVRQFSVFLQNRVGALMDLVRKFEIANNRIVALSVVDSADCSIVRIVLSDPERAYETLHAAKLPFLESDLLVVRMPGGAHPMGNICKALLAAEINIHYAYSLIVGSGQSALALHVDDHETAVFTLQKQGFTVFTENDLSD